MPCQLPVITIDGDKLKLNDSLDMSRVPVAVSQVRCAVKFGRKNLFAKHSVRNFCVLHLLSRFSGFHIGIQSADTAAAVTHIVIDS